MGEAVINALVLGTISFDAPPSFDGRNLTDIDAKNLRGIAPSSFLRADESDTAEGAINFTAKPGSVNVGGGPVYVNPAGSTSDYTLFGVALGGSSRFRVDAEGDVVINGAITSGTWQGTTIGVAYGGTGATTLTDLITLGTHTTGNYVATITAGSGISGAVSSEGATPAIALSALTADWNQTGAFDIALNNASSELKILESAGATYYGILDAGDLSADRTITLPNVGGTAFLLDGGQTITSGVWNGTALTDTYVADTLTIDSSSTVAWTALTTYPSGCAAGQTVSAVGDTLTCLAVSSSWSGITDPTGNLSLTHAANTTTMGWTSTGALDAWTTNFTNNSSTATTQRAFSIVNAVTSQTTDVTTEALLRIDNADTSTSGSTVVTDAILITNSGNIAGGITNAINIDDPDITTDIVLQNDETIDNNTDGRITVTGNLNFTGALLEDGNEILANMIAPFASSCPTGWSEYTSARGRSVVGTPLSGTNAATVGTALTDSGTRTITAVPAHTHGAGSLAADSDGAHTHSFNYGGGGGSANAVDGQAASVGTAFNVNSGGSHTHTISGTSGSTGSASVDVTMPYIQLTYCQKSAGADYAEWIRARDKYEPGTVVSADPKAAEKVKITDKPYDPAVLGIVATSPGWIVGAESQDSVALALSGRVPVKIWQGSKPISAGDSLTSSPQPGAAMKAEKSGPTLGKALEDWRAETGREQILAFVNIGTFLGEIAEDGTVYTNTAFGVSDLYLEETSFASFEETSFASLPESSESVSPPASSSAGAATQSLKDLLGKILARILEIEEKINALVLSLAEKITTKNLELVDKATGEVWCVTIENGEFVKARGECGQEVSAPEAAPEETPATPSAEPEPESSPSPSPAPSPEVTIQ